MKQKQLCKATHVCSIWDIFTILTVNREYLTLKLYITLRIQKIKRLKEIILKATDLSVKIARMMLKRIKGSIILELIYKLLLLIES